MQLTQKFVKSVGLRIALLVVSFATTILLARQLTPQEYGNYIFAFSVMSILAIPVQAGMPLLVERELSHWRVTSDLASIKGLLVRVSEAVLVFSLFLITLGMLIGFSLDVLGWDFVGQEAVLVALWLLPWVALGNVIGAAIRAFEGYLVGQVVQTFLRPLLFFLLIILVALASDGLSDAESVFGVHIWAAIAATVAGLYLFLRHSEVKWHQIASSFDSRAWFSSLLPLSLIAAMQIVLGKADIVMLRAIRSPEEVAIYHVAWQGGMFVFFANQAVRMVVSPMLARLWKANEVQQMQRVLIQGARFVLATALPLCTVVLVFGEELLNYFYGATYVAAYSVLGMIAVGYALQALFGAIDSLLMMTGLEKVILHGIGFAIVANIVLNIFLIPSYGAFGAAVATVLTTLIWKSYLVHQANVRLGILSFAFSRSRTVSNAS